MSPESPHPTPNTPHPAPHTQHVVLGVRHHGPGSARAVRAALRTLRPDIVLIEGPPDAESVLPLIMDEGLQLPVALMVYCSDAPQTAMFYPFTVFSPEWQALRYAFENSVRVRFIDLPMAHCLAEEDKKKPSVDVPKGDPPVGEGKPSPPAGEAPPAGTPGAEIPPLSDENAQPSTMREDPIGMLAEAAGYTDRELWWEHQIEQRVDATDMFQAVLEAMSAVRATADPPAGREALREAHMRQCVRTAIKEKFERIVVVCGAWHAPVLAELGPAKADADLLRGLPKTKVAATWIPWTNSRLSYRSGYGAGVASPGWYEHLWNSPGQAAVRWAAVAARLLRQKDLTASSAQVIDAVRLAEALAAMRGLPLAGLAEMNEAILTVLCHGDVAPMELIRQKLEIGDRLGAVPRSTPIVPLQQDLETRQKQVRLKASTEIKKLDLDLRKDGDRQRSLLLHQVGLLDVPWGRVETLYGKAGTFHEVWHIQWHPEFAVQIVEASMWGRTVASAAAARVRQRADSAEDLPALTALLDRALLAGLEDAAGHVLQVLQDKAAVAADVRHLMEALPPLSRVARYGDVRGTKSEQILPIIAGLFERIAIGLAGACGSLDDDAAAKMVECILHVQESVDLLQIEEMTGQWQAMLRQLMEDESIHGLVRGSCCRILVEKSLIDRDELHRLARLALSPVTPILQAAAWVEGLLKGSGLLLLHQDGVWSALDQWLVELPADVFVQTLPLLRRAFAGFSGPERRQMGEKAKRLPASDVRGGGGAAAKAGTGAVDLDLQRARRVLPVLAEILGVPYERE
ncbi:MAG: hypothetical protein AMXMBFR13_01860 [Phycisphaerae bacterium]